MSVLRRRGRASRSAGEDDNWPRLDDGWVWPRRLDPASSTATVGPVTALGTTGAGVVGVVDDRGTVQLGDRPWTVEWWVGAEDRWHRSSAEVNVRQRFLDGGPIVETHMPVPGGEIVQRVAACEADPVLVVLEFENRSAVPVALAVVIRPFALDRPGAIEEVVADGPDVRVDGAPGLVLDRVPSTMVGGRAAGDIVLRLAEGATVSSRPFTQHCDRSMATAAMVSPLTHSATIRAVVGSSDPRVFARVPPIAQISAGWLAHLALGARFDLPEGAEALARDVATVALAAARVEQPPPGASSWTISDQARLLESLVRTGYPGILADVDRWLGRADLRSYLPAAAALVVARAAAEPEPVWFDEYLGWVVDNVKRGCSRSDPDATRAVASLATLLERMGQGEAAGAVAADWLVPPSPEWSCSQAVVDPLAAAGRLVGRLDAVARANPGGVDLLPDVPSSWHGQSVDVRDMPTAHGLLSFSVRWHGARPALLWERQRWPGAAPWLLRCPGLDPGWSSTEDAGEALLAAPATHDGPAPSRAGRSIEGPTE